MTWGSISWLWALCALPLFALLPIYAWRARRKAALALGGEQSVAALTVGRARSWRAAHAVLILITLALTIVALARPQFGTRTRMLRKHGIDVVIALDFSKSMLARDVRPSRIERAKAEILRLLEELEGDRVGMVAFAGETMEFPLTVDPGAASLFFRDLGPYDMPVGGTAIGRALLASLDLIKRSNPQQDDASPEAQTLQRDHVVLLFTDGEDHEGDPVEAARQLAEANVRVYTIGIGSRTGEPIPTYAPDGTRTGSMRDENGQPVLTSLTAEAEQKLREVAQITHGKYFHAARGTVGVEEIRRELAQLHRSEVQSRRVIVHEERYLYVLVIAFGLLVLDSLLPEAWIARRKRRPT